MSIANVSIVGNLVKAPQQTQFSSGKVKTTMFVAVNNPMRKTKEGTSTADFYKVETWGKLAELVASKLDKGNQVAANGRLSMETWTDKQGRERITPTISVYDFAFPPRPRTEQPFNSRGAEEPFNSRSEEPFEPSADEGAVIKHVFAAAKSDDDQEYDEEELESSGEDEDSDDDFGKPNTSIRPAPTRGDRASPD